MEEANLQSDSEREPTGNDNIALLKLAVQRVEGEWSGWQQDGEGLARFEGAHEFKGVFSRGLMNGAGVFTHASGLKYEGEFVANMPMGKGKYTWPDGSCYEGEVCNGMRNGMGSYRCGRNGALYRGQWRMGRRHGQGTVYYNEEMSSWYKGDWINNNREGWGERRYPSGNTYCGEWKNNLRHGEGTMKWLKLGQRYVGEWQGGVQHGQGTHVWMLGRADGSRYSQSNQYRGGFLDGRRHGEGTFLYAGGAKYEGQWKSNKKHGQGKFTFRDGRVFEGEFLDDRMMAPSEQQMRDDAPLDAALPSGRDSETLGQDMALNVERLLDGFPEKIRDAERRQVEFVVLRQNTELRSIYSFYSSLGCARRPDSSSLLTRMQLWRLLKDCGVHRHGFTLTQIDRFVHGDSSSGDAHSPFTAMLLRDLLNCLVTVAYRIYKNDIPSQKHVLAACLSKLLTENILPNAKNVKGFLFQQPGFAAAALQHVEESWEVYQAHCRDQRTVTCRQLLWMFKDLHLLDDRLTTARLVEFMTAESRDAAEPSSCLDLEMSFLEVFEVLLACAEVKCPQTEDSSCEGTEAKDRESSRTEARIRSVHQFFNSCLFPAFERHRLLMASLEEERLLRSQDGE
ncbi:radial spoke head 10 homolog B [Salarias fasciatus]|uniref:radial spoke head 10 homolog B n=1 Tax=Salarias fasciatus TaxID=181472 RepID=UPI001176E0F3|nr:radial spoke head 10 homolog B2 [Salarias fasciatus]